MEPLRKSKSANKCLINTNDLEVKLKNIIIQQLDDVAGDVYGLGVK